MTSNNKSFSDNLNDACDVDSIDSDAETEDLADPTDKTSDDDTEPKDHIGAKETRAVCHLRILVILVLIACATAVAVTIYNLTHTSENNAFEIQYDGTSDKVLKAFEDIVRVKLGALASLTVAMTTHSIERNATWPFVTLSSFQRRAAIARSLSGSLYLSINHYVTDDDREEWEKYVAEDKDNYIRDSYEYFDEVGINYVEMEAFTNTSTDVLVPKDKFPIFMLNELGEIVPDPGPGPYLPSWEISPMPRNLLVNLNLMRQPWSGEAAEKSMESGLVILGDFLVAPEGGIGSNLIANFFANILSIAAWKPTYYNGDPVSAIYLPVFDSFKADRKAVASLNAQLHWASYFENVLPPTDDGIVFVLQSCTSMHTYTINGENVVYMGAGDLHDPKFDQFKKSTNFKSITSVTDSTKDGLKIDQNNCPISIDVYPSQTYYDDRTSETPLVVTISVAMTMLFAVMMFLLYDRLVERRQALVLNTANQTSAIVSSLFPKNVRARLLEIENNDENSTKFLTGKFRLKSFLHNSDDDKGLQPIADLFPETTVLFADIAGFTAWSSTREPTQVFTLLQTLYQGFDEIANRRKVFKVETIGDSYVAVTGLPDPQKKHAIIMARFAQDCLEKMYEILRMLELRLGPDTTELGMRFGMHSGPVTAGVLRGERARFQLFGDTVNTAARMESTGQPNKIQLSETTANLLSAAGKSNWLVQRADKVSAKGKGLMTSFWLLPNAKIASASHDTRSVDSKILLPIQSREDRLVDWVCEILSDPLKAIATQNQNTKKCDPSELFYKRTDNEKLIDEIAEVITLPEFDANTIHQVHNTNRIQLGTEIKKQLRQYVEAIASMYHNNSFHNFEHACHVTMSVSKVLQRIVTPDLDVGQIKGAVSLASHVHDYTYGINSDPLTILAVIFSALTHDVDHRGVSNSQLMQEEPAMASMYCGKSVAEQNSLELAWNLLMEDTFDDLRVCMFRDRTEMMRFRQALINVVLATDIFDKELNELRKKRWQKAFHDETCCKNQVNALRATIVIEHIIQASDVSHTMQHWHVYRKWNRRLFLEMHQAHIEGRMGANPGTFWYEGELGFFDNYIIPLAKKLKECGVFGVSSDEFLNYANQNRAEWAERGHEVVADLVAELSKKEEDCCH